MKIILSPAPVAPGQYRDRHDDQFALPQRYVGLSGRDRRRKKHVPVADGICEPRSSTVYQLCESVQGAGRRLVAVAGLPAGRAVVPLRAVGLPVKERRIKTNFYFFFLF